MFFSGTHIHILQNSKNSKNLLQQGLNSFKITETPPCPAVTAARGFTRRRCQCPETADSIKKINDCKIIALKVERVPNTFENLNSSEMMLKMLKMMQIYQKCKFWGFHCFLPFF
jgi:hypothetical protein